MRSRDPNDVRSWQLPMKLTFYEALLVLLLNTRRLREVESFVVVNIDSCVVVIVWRHCIRDVHGHQSNRNTDLCGQSLVRKCPAKSEISC